MRQYACICVWDAVFSLNSADSCVSRRLSFPMCPFTEEFAGDSGGCPSGEVPLPSFLPYASLSPLVNNMEEKGHLVLPSLAAWADGLFSMFSSIQRKTCRLAGCGMKMTRMKRWAMSALRRVCELRNRVWLSCVRKSAHPDGYLGSHTDILTDFRKLHYIPWYFTRCRGGVY